MPPLRRRSHATTPEGRELAARIIDAKRRGATNAQIGRAFGINERTVRKIAAGETTGRRTFERIVSGPRRVAEKRTGRNRSIVNVPMILGQDPDGSDVYASANARLPLIRDRHGNLHVATPADVFRIPKLADLIAAEIVRIERNYASLNLHGQGRIVAIRPVTYRIAPLRIEIDGIYE